MQDSITRQLLRAAARQYGYTTTMPGDNEYFLVVTGPDGQKVRFRGTLSDKTSAIGSLISRRKDLTLQYVSELGISLPPYCLYEASTAQRFLEKYSQIVVKPSDSTHSKGITINITTAEDLDKAVEYAKSFSRRDVLLQKQVTGKLYRLFVVNGNLVAAAERRAAEVIGDGTLTVYDLILKLNQDPRRSNQVTTPLNQVSLEHATAYLGDAIKSIPRIGERIRVAALDSISEGGESTDVTDEVHEDHRRLAEKITASLGLYLSGIDILIDDIAKPLTDNYWPLLEVNSGPGLKLHHYPTGGGNARDVAGAIMKDLFI
jgi:cyanophycin synthetase